MEKSDHDLVTAACLGDVSSFRELYERHYSMVVGLACSRLQDSHLAEDVAQDAFVVACRSLTSLRDGSRFPQMAGSIQESISLPSDSLIADDAEAEAEAEHSDVFNAIGKLSENQREVIYLKYFSEMSYQEIAAAIGSTPEGVHGRLQRARRSLGKALVTLTNNEVNDER